MASRRKAVARPAPTDLDTTIADHVGIKDADASLKATRVMKGVVGCVRPVTTQGADDDKG